MRVSSQHRPSGAEERGAVTRRSLLKGGAVLSAATVAAPLLSACGSSARSTAALRVRQPGGERQASLEKNVWPQFTKETGIQVETLTVNLAKLFAGLKAGTAELDVIDAGSLNLEALRAAGGLEKLDLTKLERTNPQDLLEHNDLWVASDVFAEVLAYNTRKFPSAGPGSWADFWDIAGWKATRALMDATAEKPPLEQALIADGVAIADIYPLDVDRAFAKLAEIKPHILKFWTSAAEAEQLCSSGQVDMLEMWSGRSIALGRAGAPVATVTNEAALGFQGLAIVKGSQMISEAMTYIDYFCQPEVQARFISGFPNAPSNKRAYAYIEDDKLLAMLPTAPKNVGRTFQMDYKWWGENLPKIQSRWQQFLLK